MRDRHGPKEFLREPVPPLVAPLPTSIVVCTAARPVDASTGHLHLCPDQSFSHLTQCGHYDYTWAAMPTQGRSLIRRPRWPPATTRPRMVNIEPNASFWGSTTAWPRRSRRAMRMRRCSILPRRIRGSLIRRGNLNRVSGKRHEAGRKNPWLGEYGRATCESHSPGNVEEA